MKRLATACLILALIPAAATVAKDKDRTTKAPPAVFQAVVECRTIPDSAQRLACYDRRVAALDEARAKQDLYVASKEDVKETKRGLFGFSLPNLKLFGSDDEQQVDSISVVIARVGTNPKGRYLLVMENAGRWEQIDNENIRTPRKGDTVVIKKAALGSYLAKIGNDRVFRIRRLNE